VLIDQQKLNYIAHAQKQVLGENHFDRIPFVINVAAAEKYIRASDRERFAETAPAHDHSLASKNPPKIQIFSNQRISLKNILNLPTQKKKKKCLQTQPLQSSQSAQKK
jgi:hypothetical protein